MTLIGVITALVISYLLFGWFLSKRDLKVTATVTILQSGESSVTFAPDTASAEDLVLMVLNYGSKLRWVLLSEPTEIQDIFRELTAEASDFWFEGEGPLLKQLPSATEILELLGQPETPIAVAGGERFVVRYRRTSYRFRPNRSSVTNDLPYPMLSFNGAWNYLLLLDAVYSRLDPGARVIAGHAFQLWWREAFERWEPDQSIRGLSRLIAIADSAWEQATA